MGISGLLPMLAEVSNNIHIKECKGKTLAVDAYVWLHRGAYGCAEELAKGEKTTKYVNYSMHRVRMLKYYGVTPLIVFDGGLLPSKMGTEGDREKRRNDALASGRRLEAEGRTKQAREQFVKAVDVTPEMAYQLIKALRKESIQYIVAPFEADAQLAYLEKHHLVDGIITEDSDLLIFGCSNVYFKLDPDGNCSHLARKDFTKNRSWNFAGWDEKMFRQMAILSGCDYLKSLKGVGLKTAHGLIKKYQTVERVIQFIRLSGKQLIPATYLPSFHQAELTFLHQLVYDPVQKKIVPLTPLPEGMEKSDVPFIGDWFEDEYVQGVARGEIDPITKEKMRDIVPENVGASQQYQTQTFKITKSKATTAVATGASSILKYFQPKASTSTTTTSKPKLTKVTAKGKGKAREEEVRGGGLQSKFFGGSGGNKGKGKENAGMEEEDEDVIMEEVGEEDEVIIEGPEVEEDEFAAEEEYMRELELEAAPEQEEDDDPFDLDTLPDPDETNIPAFPAPTIHHQPQEDRAASPSSLVDFSSPAPQLGPVRDLDDEEDEGFASEFTAVSSPERRGTSVVAEGELFSSPSTSPNSRTSSSSGGKIKVKDEVVVFKSEKKFVASASNTSTPTIKIKEEKKVVKKEKQSKKSPSSSSNNSSMADEILLSSDPIELFSEPAHGENVDMQDEIKDSNTQVDRKPKIAKTKGKKRARDEEEEEEVDPVKATVAASWRAKFMNPLSSTPKSKANPSISTPKAFARASSSTPLAKVNRPSLKTPSSQFTPKPKPVSTSTGTPTALRAPLSPKATNRISHDPELGGPSSKVMITNKRLLAFRFGGETT